MSWDEKCVQRIKLVRTNRTPRLRLRITLPSSSLFRQLPRYRRSRNKTNKGPIVCLAISPVSVDRKWESFAAWHAIRGMARLIIPRIVRARHPRAHPCVFSYTEPGDPRESCTTLFNSILFRSCYPAISLTRCVTCYSFLSIVLGCFYSRFYLPGIDDSRMKICSV